VPVVRQKLHLPSCTDFRSQLFVRTLIHEVIADIDAEAAEIVLLFIGWVAFIARYAYPDDGVGSAVAPHQM
jgi:hypothetical protein